MGSVGKERDATTVMFESSEEVKKAMMDLKIFEAIDGLGSEEAGVRQEEEDEDEYTPQIFPEHTSQSAEYRKTLYYGALPATDRPSMPLTRLAVDQFTSSGLDALGQKLGRLDMARASDISRQACAGPNSLVLALLYLDRLRRRNPEYLTTVSSADLFLVSLMVASKFLHDDGEEDEVFNDEWATSGGMDTKELNQLELRFLAALDWRIFVDVAEFQATLQAVEADIAVREVINRNSASYTDLVVLGSRVQASHLLTLLTQAAIKVTAVCVTTYAAGLLTLLGTAAALSRTPLGPEAVSNSVRTLARACSGLEDQDVVTEKDQMEDIRSNNLTTKDLVTASLLVTTLTSAPLTGDMEDEDELSDLVQEGHRRLGEEDVTSQQQLNRSRALWLSEYSLDRGLDQVTRPPDPASSYSVTPGLTQGVFESSLPPSLLSGEPWPGGHSMETPGGGGGGQEDGYRCPLLQWMTPLGRRGWHALVVS